MIRSFQAHRAGRTRQDGAHFPHGLSWEFRSQTPIDAAAMFCGSVSTIARGPVMLQQGVQRRSERERLSPGEDGFGRFLRLDVQPLDGSERLEPSPLALRQTTGVLFDLFDGVFERLVVGYPVLSFGELFFHGAIDLPCPKDGKKYCQQAQYQRGWY